MIAKLIYSSIFANLNRGVEQLVARWAHNPKVAGSSPVPATKEKESLIALFFLFQSLNSNPSTITQVMILAKLKSIKPIKKIITKDFLSSSFLHKDY